MKTKFRGSFHPSKDILSYLGMGETAPMIYIGVVLKCYSVTADGSGQSHANTHIHQLTSSEPPHAEPPPKNTSSFQGAEPH